ARTGYADRRLVRRQLGSAREPDAEWPLRPQASLARAGIQTGPNGHVGDALAGIVLEQRDLFRTRPTGGTAHEVGELVDRLEVDHAALNGVEQITLLILNRLLARGRDDHVHAADRLVVELTPLARGEPALHEPYVAGDDRRHMLPRLQPGSIEDRDA